MGTARTYLALAVMAVMAVGAQAAITGYLKIEGIDGESRHADHRNWIDIQSYSHSMASSESGSTGSTRGPGTVEHEDIAIIKQLDKASPSLMLACNEGRHTSVVDIEFVRTGASYSHVFYKVQCSDVLISSVAVDVREGGTPTETITLNYRSIRWTYVVLTGDGTAGETVEEGWSLLDNTALGKIYYNPNRMAAEAPAASAPREYRIHSAMGGRGIGQGLQRVFDLRGRRLPAVRRGAGSATYIVQSMELGQR
jgi:type VI secretion system secreted protein Hcp